MTNQSQQHPRQQTVVTAIETFTQSFEPVTLKQMDKLAKMLKRSENKYVVSREQLLVLISDLSKDFYILDIENKRSFGYETIYFDEDTRCYQEHVQRKRQRFKVRTRRYLDADLNYFEVKLKGKRGQTNKRRFQCEAADHGELTEKGLALLQKSFRKYYHKKFDMDLSPVMSMRYKRITLVAKSGGERFTIDYGLCLSSGDRHKVEVPDDFIILETKSHNGNGIADKILRRHRHRAVDSCSKFCLSMILSGKVSNYNHFLPLLRTYFADYGFHRIGYAKTL